MTDNILGKVADNIRILSASMVENANSGHPGGAMGGADFISVLFSEFLRYDPEDPQWFFRDRFYLDPGHMSPMLYGTLYLSGKYTVDDIRNFRKWGSCTPGHPELDVARGIENTSGPLGMGHAIALGAAVAERFIAERFGEWTSHKIYAFISDGGIQEEVSQGVGRLAGHLGLSNFILFFDSNDIQLSTETDEVTSENTSKKYESWGWRVETIDGNDIGQIREALKRAVEEKERPSLIIGKTAMAKGALKEDGSSFERKVSTHGMPLSKAGASIEKTITNLEGNPSDPFAVFPEVADYIKGVKEKKAAAAKERKDFQIQWEKDNPESAVRLHNLISGIMPEIDYGSIKQKPDSATRSASGAVLSVFAQNLDNMIVCSADLCNSDKTEEFLKFTEPFRRGNFSGKFLQAGVSELTMAAVSNGIALHGIIPVCGTFFVFSDYMKPAVRLAALMSLPVKYVWTHDSFRVGEDGPTHQPVEHEAQIRLLEQMKNPKGKRSMLVLRPADAQETTVAWKMAMENRETPTGLILTRQSVPDIKPPEGGDRFEEALNAFKGAYIIRGPEGKPDIVLVANGSDLSLIIDTAQILLETKGLRAQVVSVISEGLFREQPVEYQNSVLPFGLPVFGVTSGLPCTLERLVGPLGKVFGLSRFGASAPYKVLNEKFGYLPELVLKEVEKYLEEYKVNISRIKDIYI